MSHHAILVGHSGHPRLTDILCRTYYWPQMVADLLEDMLLFALRKELPSSHPKVERKARILRNDVIRMPRDGLVGPLPASNASNKYILVITELFTKLIQVV